jgi:hypothetical protein
MTGNGRAPDPTELVYESEPSWAPLFVAFGIAGVLVGLFAGWVWAAVGGVLALLALRSWVSGVADELRRLPREQRLTTATLPPTTLRERRS